MRNNLPFRENELSTLLLFNLPKMIALLELKDVNENEKI